MAGRPLRNAMIAALARRTTELFGDEEKEDGSDYNALDFACVYVENGRTITQLMAELELELNGGVLDGSIVLGRSMLMRYLESLGPSNDLLALARDAGAHAMVETAHAKLDDKSNDGDRDKLNANDKRLQAKERLAAVWSQEFRRSKDTGVHITIGSLHLEGLKKVNAERATLPAATARIVAEDSDEE